MFKNVAGQKVAVQALDSATGRPKTGDAANISVYVSKDHGAPVQTATTAVTELSATNAPGLYIATLSQSETNADTVLISGKSTTGGVDIVANPFCTLPPNFTALAIDATGSVAIQCRLKKNTALSNLHFVMTDSTTHNPVPGKTVTATRLIDGGTFAAGTLGTVTEVSDGVYRLDIPAADLNGNTVTLKMTAGGCDALIITLLMEP